MPAFTPVPRVLRFGPFVANLRSGELLKGSKKLRLQEQPFKILALLLERAGEVVTREELQKKLWSDNTFVDFDHGINMCIGKIREALGDSTEKPKFVETLGRRGYRFIAKIEIVTDYSVSSPLVSRVTPSLALRQHYSVGRAKELAQLEAAFESAAGGRGLLVCVAGEPGIGKTTLVQDFLSGLEASGKAFSMAIGRCSQRFAGEEAYLPFLEALDSLLRGDAQLTRILRDFAPSWYAQLFPVSESDASDAASQAHARATTQEKVKRELAAFFCEITRQNPFVLFFDDVHWTDPSTIDLLSHLGTKFDSARILVIVTYRPTELLLLKHPFIGVKRELRGRDLCREINVEFLSPADVERYIGLEFLGNRFPRKFAGLIHATTEGNPLFMVDLLRFLRDRKVIVKLEGDEGWSLAQSLPGLSRNIPQSVSSVIERKIDQLSERDREVLTVAAVQGYECDSAAVARALAAENMEMEEILDRLEQVHAFVRRVSEEELPGGAPTVRYRFVHVLYQNALYARLTPTRRVALSAALAQALEALHGERSSAIASQLAFLYETARNPQRASDYFLLAAQNAQNMFAHQEAISLARRGLALLDKLPRAVGSMPKELGLQTTLALSLMCTLGYAAPETGAAMRQAHRLCQTSGNNAALCPILWGLWAYYLCKGDMKLAREAAEHMLSISRDLNDPALLVGSHCGLAMSLLHQGELGAARAEFEEVARLYDVAQQSRYVQLYQFDPGVHSTAQFIRSLWLLGYPDQARQKAEDTLAMARRLSAPLSLAFLELFTAQLFQQLRQPEKCRELAHACIALCDEQAIQLERAWADCWHGWALTKLGEADAGLLQIRSGIEAQLSVGSHVARPYTLAVLADALWYAQRQEEGLQAVEEGFASSKRNGEPFYDAELWRLKGELLKMQGNTTDAEPCFQQAIEISREQSAKSLELRAATSLARLWKEGRKCSDAVRFLGETYSWFTEGFDTADLQEARSLLRELS